MKSIAYLAIIFNKMHKHFIFVLLKKGGCVLGLDDVGNDGAVQEGLKRFQQLTGTTCETQIVTHLEEEKKHRQTGAVP